MTTMTLQLDDAKADAFREKARRIGMEPEQLLAEFIDDLIKQENDFEAAVERVLAKNRDLYRRLA
ncbi:hypothetical protein [Thiohalocapsa sp. ML1]|jgi:predicted transcriptional regulator|uniref:hypothetical protein n=1 Tax=Thiohalocapsa sp. ML1 TaxID=1431688 RepID=UPI0007321B43|nr:hypothetical protein [Thiohalocapsa sp. ML1]